MYGHVIYLEDKQGFPSQEFQKFLENRKIDYSKEFKEYIAQGNNRDKDEYDFHKYALANIIFDSYSCDNSIEMGFVDKKNNLSWLNSADRMFFGLPTNGLTIAEVKANHDNFKDSEEYSFFKDKEPIFFDINNL